MNKVEELLEMNSMEGGEALSCNQILMTPSAKEVPVSLDWRSTKMKRRFLGAPDRSGPEHATPGASSLKKGSL